MTERRTCGWCGRRVEIETSGGGRGDADLFCTECGLPLFLDPLEPTRHVDDAATATATSAVGLVLPSPELDPMTDPRRRWPSVRGRDSLSVVACPSCDEPNDWHATTCHRCGGALQPTPADPVTDDTTTPGDCTRADGQVGERTIDVPDWLLIALGAVLVVLVVWLLVRLV